MFVHKAAAVVAATVLLAACGNADDDDTPQTQATTAEEFPVTVEGALGEVTVDDEPVRIVSLSPTATETLFAIGAGDQVVAVDDQSDYPADAPTTDLSGFEPNVEAIVEYEPDLVVISDDSPSDLTDALDQLGIPVLAESAATDLDQAYEQIGELGAITGHADDADELADDMQDRIDEVVADLPDGPEVTVFHELGPDLYTASSDTFIGQVYEHLGLINVADEAAEQAGTPYPQVSPEYLLTADPDLVILADGECCGVTPEQAATRPGWDALSAVRNGAVISVDEDISSRWGPRVPEFVEAVADAVRTVREAS
jgi:iron complex transport system substrate-binding protein